MTTGLRITSGRFRGRLLQAPEGEATRPLLTRVRKSLVDILRPRLSGSRVLDLFGGSGAVTAEVLSNGAAEAVVVELDARAAEQIRANIRSLGLEESVSVREGDALGAIVDLYEQGARFDLVVVAPPYGQGLQQRALDLLGAQPLLEPGGLIVVQRDRTEPTVDPHPPLRLTRTRAYGRTVLEFYECSR